MEKGPETEQLAIVGARQGGVQQLAKPRVESGITGGLGEGNSANQDLAAGVPGTLDLLGARTSAGSLGFEAG